MSTKLVVEMNLTMVISRPGGREAALKYWADMNPVDQREEMMSILTDGDWSELEIVDAKIGIDHR